MYHKNKRYQAYKTPRLENVAIFLGFCIVGPRMSWERPTILQTEWDSVPRTPPRMEIQGRGLIYEIGRCIVCSLD